MPFTVTEFHDLIQILEQQPEWRAELRRLVLTDELLSLPQLVRDLAEAQQRTEERLGRLEQAVQALAQAQQKTAWELSSLATQISTLADMVQRLAVDVGQIKGTGLEVKYERHAAGYFGRIIRRPHVVSGDELVELLGGLVDRGQLSEAEYDEVVLADLLVRGRRGDHGEVYLVVEISWGIGHDDIRRAVERAALLARAGLQTIPVVAGDWVSPDAQENARLSKVWQVTDGRTVPPEAA